MASLTDSLGRSSCSKAGLIEWSDEVEEVLCPPPPPHSDVMCVSSTVAVVLLVLSIIRKATKEILLPFLVLYCRLVY